MVVSSEFMEVLIEETRRLRNPARGEDCRTDSLTGEMKIKIVVPNASRTSHPQASCARDVEGAP